MPVPKEKLYTYSDYLEWDDGKRYELIDGVAYAMAAAPLRVHQEVSLSLASRFFELLKNKPCKVYTAPFDVRLSSGTRGDTVVQPDISVICDIGKLDEKGCNGAPDMVVEILSPKTVKYDMLTKFNLYLRFGVHEYWIIDPESKTLHTYILENGKYVASVYGDTDIAPVSVLDGCVICLSEIFEY